MAVAVVQVQPPVGATRRCAGQQCPDVPAQLRRDARLQQLPQKLASPHHRALRRRRQHVQQRNLLLPS